MSRRFPPRSRAFLPAPVLVAVLAGLLADTHPAMGLAGEGGPAPDAARALRAAADLRPRIAGAAAAAPGEESWLVLAYRGRPAVEIKGRAAGAAGSAGALRDLTIYDISTGRVVSHVWFPHASARRAGEPIIGLGEASSRAEEHLRRLFPGATLALDGIQRYRASGQESVYYEAAFTDVAAEVPFLAPPVRLLLDASTGNLFRFDVEPEWYAPPRAPAARLSRKAAERIATAALGTRDLGPLLGAGAVFGKAAAAELFLVRPNDWLGAAAADGGEARIAWVVPFSLAADPGRAVHRLFVDAATGRLLGGLP